MKSNKSIHLKKQQMFPQYIKTPLTFQHNAGQACQSLQHSCIPFDDYSLSEIEIQNDANSTYSQADTLIKIKDQIQKHEKSLFFSGMTIDLKLERKLKSQMLDNPREFYNRTESLKQPQSPKTQFQRQFFFQEFPKFVERSAKNKRQSNNLNNFQIQNDQRIKSPQDQCKINHLIKLKFYLDCYGEQIRATIENIAQNPQLLKVFQFYEQIQQNTHDQQQFIFKVKKYSVYGANALKTQLCDGSDFKMNLCIERLNELQKKNCFLMSSTRFLNLTQDQIQQTDFYQLDLKKSPNDLRLIKNNQEINQSKSITQNPTIVRQLKKIFPLKVSSTNFSLFKNKLSFEQRLQLALIPIRKLTPNKKSFMNLDDFGQYLQNERKKIAIENLQFYLQNKRQLKQSLLIKKQLFQTQGPQEQIYELIEEKTQEIKKIIPSFYKPQRIKLKSEKKIYRLSSLSEQKKSMNLIEQNLKVLFFLSQLPQDKKNQSIEEFGTWLAQNKDIIKIKGSICSIKQVKESNQFNNNQNQELSFFRQQNLLNRTSRSPCSRHNKTSPIKLPIIQNHYESKKEELQRKALQLFRLNGQMDILDYYSQGIDHKIARYVRENGAELDQSNHKKGLYVPKNMRYENYNQSKPSHSISSENSISRMISCSDKYLKKNKQSENSSLLIQQLMKDEDQQNYVRNLSKNDLKNAKKSRQSFKKSQRKYPLFQYVCEIKSKAKSIKMFQNQDHDHFIEKITENDNQDRKLNNLQGKYKEIKKLTQLDFKIDQPNTVNIKRTLSEEDFSDNNSQSEENLPLFSSPDNQAQIKLKPFISKNSSKELIEPKIEQRDMQKDGKSQNLPNQQTSKIKNQPQCILNIKNDTFFKIEKQKEISEAIKVKQSVASKMNILPSSKQVSQNGNQKQQQTVNIQSIPSVQTHKQTNSHLQQKKINHNSNCLQQKNIQNQAAINQKLVTGQNKPLKFNFFQQQKKPTTNLFGQAPSIFSQTSKQSTQQKQKQIINFFQQAKQPTANLFGKAPSIFSQSSKQPTLEKQKQISKNVIQSKTEVAIQINPLIASNKVSKGNIFQETRKPSPNLFGQVSNRFLTNFTSKEESLTSNRQKNSEAPPGEPQPQSNQFQFTSFNPQQFKDVFKSPGDLKTFTSFQQNEQKDQNKFQKIEQKLGQQLASMAAFESFGPAAYRDLKQSQPKIFQHSRTHNGNQHKDNIFGSFGNTFIMAGSGNKQSIQRNNFGKQTGSSTNPLEILKQNLNSQVMNSEKNKIEQMNLFISAGKQNTNNFLSNFSGKMNETHTTMNIFGMHNVPKDPSNAAKKLFEPRK